MAVENVEQIPGNDGKSVVPGADNGSVQDGSQNDGSRADTSRVATNPDGTPKDQNPKEKTFSFKEDRSDWVPRTRLNDESGKRTKLESTVAQLQQDIELRDKRLRLAMGLEVPSKEDQEANELREGLYKLNPKLKLLDRLDEDAIDRLLRAAESAESTSQATWARHREEMLTGLESEVVELLNVEKLTDQQRARLQRDFKSYAREEAAKRTKAEQAEDPNYDFNNDFVSRYERGDRKLLVEFAKAFIDEWVTPARRQANSSTLFRQNRPTPNGGRSRTAVTQGPPKINYNDEDAFKGALIAARRGGDDGV